ncbi:MAG: UDP-N-acetylmuramoyl-tripeptide--D-alanyl-D-alanine ligase [Clostridiales bacterium]|nr:UDP-N-acetylmuramoyl-tripeptide--D-alanyl-D-alanine ligase [Clostridiales bacterium]
MIKITLEELLKITEGSCTHPSTAHCTSIEIDSRRVNNQTYFMPILGEVHDGHKFIEGAFSKGAPTSFCEKAYYYSHQSALKDYPLILVDNTTTALHKLTVYILKKTQVKTVGITGSVGKTSTKEFIYHVLSKKYSVHKNKGNFNNHIGLPLTVMDLKYEHDVAILEMGMNHFKEIEVLADIARPSVAVVTNIGTSHIGILGSRENIFQAKMEITSYLNEDDTLILNGEDNFLREVSSQHFKCIQVGKDQLQYSNVLQKPSGFFEYSINYNKSKYRVSLNVLGKHNIINSLLAIAVGLAMDVSIEDCILGVSEFVDSDKRLEILTGKKNSVLISDCYNASQESMISAIEVLNSFSEKKIAVLGDVLELGEFSKQSHETVGEYLSAHPVDMIITLGCESEHIINKAIALGFDQEKTRHFDSVEPLYEYLENIIEDSVCLIKGSLGMNMARIVEVFKGGNIDTN